MKIAQDYGKTRTNGKVVKGSGRADPAPIALPPILHQVIVHEQKSLDTNYLQPFCYQANLEHQ